METQYPQTLTQRLRAARVAQAMAELDSADMETVIGRHLWLVASKRCSCGDSAPGKLGTHYAWWITHLTVALHRAGFARVMG